MKTKNIIGFNGVTKPNEEDIIYRKEGVINYLRERRFKMRRALKKYDGVEKHIMDIEAKFGSSYQGWEFNANDKEEMKEFNEIGFKKGQKIIWYKVKGGKNLFELVKH